MSAGDPSDTIPPPVGEDDAYSATTKVGAMPAELMAKLRAEGLLPDPEERRVPRPEKVEKSTLRSLATAEKAALESSPPSIASQPPGKDDVTMARPIAGAPPPPARIPSFDDDALVEEEPTDDAPQVEVLGTASSIPPNGSSSERPGVETPVAFAASPDALAVAPDTNITTDAPAPSKTARLVAVFAILALVAIAMVLALSGRGR